MKKTFNKNLFFCFLLLLFAVSCKNLLNSSIPNILEPKYSIYNISGEKGYKVSFDLSSNAEPTFVIINKIKHPIQASEKQGLKYNVNVISETRKIENYKLNSTTRENGIVFKVNNREVFAPVDFKLSK